MNTIDVVVEGASAMAERAVLDAARRGRHVLVVVRPRRSRMAQQLRRALRLLTVSPAPRVTVLTGAEVVCVDGLAGIEAVIVRDVRTGRLTGFNAGEVLCFPE